MAKQTGKTKRTSTRRRTATARRFSNRTVVGILGALLALWLICQTLTVQPLRWGTIAEELIIALCVVFALRLLCIAKLPRGLTVASLILLPAGIIVYGAYASAAEGANVYRFACLAGTGVLSLLTARLLDPQPDGVLLGALLLLISLPGLFAADTLFIEELMRLFLTAGVFFIMVSIREKAPWMALCAALLFGLAGTAGLYAAFVAAGAAAGVLLAAPKKQRGIWVLSVVLSCGLALGALLFVGQLPVLAPFLTTRNPMQPSVWAGFLDNHLIRVLATGALLFALRFFTKNEDAAIPLVLALLCGEIARLAFPGSAPGVLMDAPLLAALAGAGIAKTARGGSR